MKRWSWVLAALLMVVTACGGAGDATTTADAPAEAAADLSLLSGDFGTIDGSTIDLGSLEGQDVVLWFWAPW